MIRRIAVGLSPLLLLALYPLSSFVFLGDIRPWLLPLSLAGVLYLMAVRLNRSPAARRRPEAVALRSAWRRFKELPPGAAAVRLFWAALILYVFLLSGAVVPAQPFTGDEPHYLLISESLLRDGDINLADDYAELRYRAFYGGPLRPHAWPGREGPGFTYSQHFPGISALVAPFHALGRLTTTNRAALVSVARFPLAVLSALLASVFFLFSADIARTRSAALLGWVLFAAGSPFVFYSSLVYSEVPPALITLSILYALVLRRRTSAAVLVLSGVGIGLMPWFGIKYLVLAGGVFLAAAVSIALDAENKLRDLLRLALPAAVPLGLLAAFLRTTYGGLSPALIYRGAPGAPIPFARFFISGLLEVGNHFLGLVLDQRAGIFVWGPVLLLSLPGAVLLLRVRRRRGWLLLTPLAVWWGFSAAVHSWGAFCPPGRPLLPVLPIFAGLAAVALGEATGRTRRSVRAALVAATILMTLAALRNPRLLYHDNLANAESPKGVSSLLLTSAKTLALDATRIAPSLSSRRPEERRSAPVPFWLLGIGLLAWVWLKSPSPPPGPTRPFAAHAAGTIVLSLLLLAFVFLRVDLDEARAGDVPGGRVYLQDESAFGIEGDGFWTRGRAAATAVLRTASPARRIEVRVSSRAAGDVEIAVGPRRGRVRLATGEGSVRAFMIDDPVGLRAGKDRCLYTVRVRASRAFAPRAEGSLTGNGRVLGAFVRIRAVPR